MYLSVDYITITKELDVRNELVTGSIPTDI